MSVNDYVFINYAVGDGSVMQGSIRINKANLQIEMYNQGEWTVISGDGGNAFVMTSAQRMAITPSQGQLIYDSDNGTLYVGDGLTVGGVAVGTGGGGTEYQGTNGITVSNDTISANTATASEMVSGTTSTKLVDANAYRTLNRAEPVVFGGSTASLAANTEFEFCSGEMSLRKDDKIQVYFEFSGDFGSFDLIHEIPPTRGRKYTVTATAIEFYDVNGNLLSTYDHGLTLDTFVNLSIQRRVLPASDHYVTFVKLTLSTLSGSYINEDFPDYLDFGSFVFKPSFAVSNVVANYIAADARKKIWLFGDSWTELISYGWPTYLPFNLLDNIMLGGRSGANSVAAISTLRLLIAKSRPEYIVWAMGINDHDPEGTYNESWRLCLDEVRHICSNNCIKLILVTIPSTPLYNNTHKNEYIHSLSGYKVIDFAKALNADTAGAEWYEGMLQSDNLHPTPLGAKHLAEAFTQYFADAFYYSDSSVTANQLTGDAIKGGFGITATDGTVSLARYKPVEEISGGTVTLQAGYAYRAYATTSSLTIKCETFNDDLYGLDAQLELFVGGTGFVVASENVRFANAIEPDSVNNCVVKFHDGLAVIHVTDHIAGYVVLSASGSFEGSLPYGLSALTVDYISFDVSLNGQTFDMLGAVINSEKHVVGNGYTETIVSGGINCNSKITFANLGMDGVIVSSGTVTLGDVYIPSGSTVAVSGGGLAVENVTGDGGVIDLGGTNVIVSSGTTANASGCTFTGGSGTSAGAFFVSGTLKMSNTSVVGNTASQLIVAGGIQVEKGRAELVSCFMSGNYRSNLLCDLSVLPDAEIMLSGSTVCGLILTDGGTVKIADRCVFSNILMQRRSSVPGFVTISSGAIVDLTGNSNATPITPKGSVIVSGGCTVINSAGTSVSIAGGTYTQINNDGTTVPPQA